MKQDFTALLERLTQSVKALQHRYDARKREFVTAKFDVALFSENFQPVDFYLKELDYSLEQLQRLTELDIAQFAFFTEKLSAQCAALTDALERKNNPFRTDLKTSNTQQLTAKEKRRQELEKLPPRERLIKYYEALNALNEKMTTLQDQRRVCQSEEQKIQYDNMIMMTQSRQQRCLEAIELLEEYLAFKEKKKID